MRRLGFDVIELRCPHWLRNAPRPLRNVAFVFFEQLIAPLVRTACKCSVAVYPYNSTSLLDAALGRGVLIVHDLLSNRRSNRSLAAQYVRWTQGLHIALARPVCAASERTLLHLRRLEPFRSVPLCLWPNPFYSFESALKRHVHRKRRRSTGPVRVLLCSGIGPNKDYAGAIRIFVGSQELRKAELRIIGFGRDAELANRRVMRLPPALRSRVAVLPRLTIDEVIEEYLACDLVWVHSKHEGFGRWIVEAKLCGRPVVASRISALLKFASPGVHYYRKDEFDQALRAAMDDTPLEPLTDLGAYHLPLEEAIRGFLESVHHRAHTMVQKSPPSAAGSMKAGNPE